MTHVCTVCRKPMLPDQDYTETGVHSDCLDGGLDAAWAEAEAALPEGWTFSLSRAIRPVTEDAEPTYYATVSAPWTAEGIKSQVGGSTPAAALRALAVQLGLAR